MWRRDKSYRNVRKIMLCLQLGKLVLKSNLLRFLLLTETPLFSWLFLWLFANFRYVPTAAPPWARLGEGAGEEREPGAALHVRRCPAAAHHRARCWGDRALSSPDHAAVTCDCAAHRDLHQQRVAHQRVGQDLPHPEPRHGRADHPGPGGRQGRRGQGRQGGNRGFQVDFVLCKFLLRFLRIKINGAARPARDIEYPWWRWYIGFW